MDSTLSPTQVDPHHDGGEVLVLAPKDQTVAEEPLSRPAQEAAGRASDSRTRIAGSEIFAGLRVAEPSLDATLHPADLKNDRFPSDRPSLSKRASRALARFLIAAFIGVAATLAWQSYGEAAKQMIASWAPQFGWSLSPPATNPPPGPEIVAEQPSPSAVQASAVGAAKASAAAVIHVEHGDSPAGPILNAQNQRGNRCRSRAAVTFDQQRRPFVRGSGEVAVLRRIEKAVRG